MLPAVAERNNMSVWEAAMGEWWTLMDWRYGIVSGDCSGLSIVPTAFTAPYIAMYVLING